MYECFCILTYHEQEEHREFPLSVLVELLDHEQLNYQKYPDDEQSEPDKHQSTQQFDPHGISGPVKNVLCIHRCILSNLMHEIFLKI